MCGIIGYIGQKQASSILVEGLSKLEYRGYDSAGVSVINNSLVTRKFKGRLANLAENIKTTPLPGHIGIGHTRWATHGEPSDFNSHPHLSSNEKISVVHNGIIENYIDLKNFLKSKGYTFLSETDTEVIPNLIDYYYEGDLFDAIVKATSKLNGSYALGVISSYEPNKIVAVRKDSPLIIGIGLDEYYIASDIPAILNHTRNIYLLEDDEFAILEAHGINLKNRDSEKIDKKIFNVTWNNDSAEKNGFDDFMLKEIYEQPKVIENTFKNLDFKNLNFSQDYIKNLDKICIVACGTAYHAGLIGKTVIEKFSKIPVEIDVASEFRYREPLITDKTLLIVVSQSGETADTLAALRLAKDKNAKVLAITNVVGSSISREANNVIYTLAGPEIAVASTKAYTTQLIAFYMLGLHFAELKNSLPSSEISFIREEISEIPSKIEEILQNKDNIKKFSKENYNHKDMYFLGRGLDYAVALEGSLKLKEISYIHCDAYPAGELKHGPIALIEKGVSVISLLTQEELKEKMISNIKEVITRGGNILLVCNKSLDISNDVYDNIIYIPDTISVLTPLISVIPLQLLSYYIAKNKGLDVDKPRNLAKSVTVE